MQNILAGASCEYLLFKTGGTRFTAMVKVTDIVTGEVEMQGGADLNQFEREYTCLEEMEVKIYSPICSQHFPLFRQAMPRCFTCTICQLSRFTKCDLFIHPSFYRSLSVSCHSSELEFSMFLSRSVNIFLKRFDDALMNMMSAHHSRSYPPHRTLHHHLSHKRSLNFVT
jgi:hypothetical protein